VKKENKTHTFYSLIPEYSHSKPLGRVLKMSKTAEQEPAFPISFPPPLQPLATAFAWFHCAPSTSLSSV